MAPTEEEIIVGGRRRRRARRPALSHSTRPVARHSTIYDIDGPKVRIGALWALLLGASLVAGLTAVAAVYAVVATVAALQATGAWRRIAGGHPDQVVAGAGAGALVLAARLGVGAMGLAMVGLAVAAAAACLARAGREGRTTAAALADVGLTLQCAVFPGLAAASPVLAGRVQLGAAVVLVVLVCAYEVGDFVVGSGSANVLEGPIAGIVCVAVITFSLTVFDQLIGIPPFDGFSLVFFGVAVGVLAPFGPVISSILLPRADARAPALRRIDTLVVAGPVWTLALWAHVGF